MKLFLILYGTPDYEDDSQRPLTEKGRDKMHKIASALKRLGLKPDRIVSSPFSRNRQTADILAKVLQYTPEVAISKMFITMSNADDIKRIILTV